MPRKKLGIFRKALGKVGKRLMWAISKKINRLFLHAAWKSALLSLSKLTENDTGEAARIWYEIGRSAGDSLMYTWLDKAKMLYSKKLEDMKVVIESAWHAFLGNSPDETGVLEIIGDYNLKIIFVRAIIPLFDVHPRFWFLPFYLLS